MSFTVKNPHIYQTNSSGHGMNTKQQNKLHMFQEDFPQCREVSTTQPLTIQPPSTKYI
jgi:hypothetical protein